MSQDNITNNMNTVPVQSTTDTAKNKNMKTVLVSSLNSHPRNQEFFDDMYGEEWESFKAHIAAHGIRSAITIGKDGTITSGHQRVRACKELGITEIPALIIDYASDDEMLLDLISTNLKQRGVGNLNPFKLGACIKELERIYGVQNGTNQYVKRDNPMGKPSKTQKQLMDEFKIEIHKWQRCKQMADMIPELQALVTNETITARTALDIARKLPEEEQRKLISGLDPDSKYTAKQINTEIAALKAEKERLANEVREKDAQIASKDAEIDAAVSQYKDQIAAKDAEIDATVSQYKSQLDAKDAQMEADRQKYNEAVKARDEKFKQERAKLNKELDSKDAEIERLYANPPKPADYDSTRKQNVLLKDEAIKKDDLIKRINAELEAYRNQASKYTESSEEYQRLMRKVEALKEEVENLKVEKNAQMEMVQLMLSVREFLTKQLAPVKFMECFRLIRSKPVVGADLINIVDMVDQWSAEMHKITDTLPRIPEAKEADIVWETNAENIVEYDNTVNMDTYESVDVDYDTGMSDYEIYK